MFSKFNAESCSLSSFFSGGTSAVWKISDKSFYFKWLTIVIGVLVVVTSMFTDVGAFEVFLKIIGSSFCGILFASDFPLSSVFIIFFEIKYVADNIEALTKAISKAEVSNKLPNVQIVYFGIESTKCVICLQNVY